MILNRTTNLVLQTCKTGFFRKGSEGIEQKELNFFNQNYFVILRLSGVRYVKAHVIAMHFSVYFVVVI